MEERYPLLTERIQSTFIDTLMIVVLMFVFSSMLERFESVPDWVRIGMFVSLLAYEPICMSIGSTFGNYLMKIRVRKNDDTAKRLSIVQAIIRYPIKIVLGWISFLTINSNPRRRAMHDLVSGSVMIKI